MISYFRMSAGRGRGRGRGRLTYQNQFPELGEWMTPKKPFRSTNASSSSNTAAESAAKSVKEVLLEGDTYYLNSLTDEIVFYIDNNDSQWMSDPWEIKDRYIQNQSFIPMFDQYRYIYEAMLTATTSVEFTHHKLDERRNSPIKYSKAIIRNVIGTQRWGTSLNQSRTLQAPLDQKYNYWDYQKAFYNTFYYQNPIRSHSWFFKIEPSIISSGQNIPTWFFVWFDSFGPNQADKSFMPPSVKEAYDSWYAIYLCIPETKNSLTSNIFAIFFITFSIPWIWKWEFTCEKTPRPCLKRKFFFKWWKGNNNEELVAKIKEQTSALLNFKPKPVTPSPEGNIFSSITRKLKKDFPNLSEEELLAKSLKFLKDQFMEAHASDEDASMRSGSDTEICIAGEAQPNQEEETVGDYWDAMTDIVLAKINKGKNKQ